MSRAKKPIAGKTKGAEFLLSIREWSCTHFGKQSEIEVHVGSTGKWETIAIVHSIVGFDAEDIAGFIVGAISKQKEILPNGSV